MSVAVEDLIYCYRTRQITENYPCTNGQDILKKRPVLSNAVVLLDMEPLYNSKVPWCELFWFRSIICRREAIPVNELPSPAMPFITSNDTIYNVIVVLVVVVLVGCFGLIMFVSVSCKYITVSECYLYYYVWMLNWQCYWTPCYQYRLVEFGKIMFLLLKPFKVSDVTKLALSSLHWRALCWPCCFWSVFNREVGLGCEVRFQTYPLIVFIVISCLNLATIVIGEPTQHISPMNQP